MNCEEKENYNPSYEEEKEEMEVEYINDQPLEDYTKNFELSEVDLKN